MSRDHGLQTFNFRHEAGYKWRSLELRRLLFARHVQPISIVSVWESFVCLYTVPSKEIIICHYDLQYLSTNWVKATFVKGIRLINVSTGLLKSNFLFWYSYNSFNNIFGKKGIWKETQ